jgi:hypothetical protein
VRAREKRRKIRTKRNVKRSDVACRQYQEHGDLCRRDGRHNIGQRVGRRLPVHYIENAAELQSNAYLPVSSRQENEKNSSFKTL